jgi:hypothetical protein
MTLETPTKICPETAHCFKTGQKHQAVYIQTKVCSVFSIFHMRVLNCNIRGVSKRFGKLYQKTNKTEDTNKLTAGAKSVEYGGLLSVSPRLKSIMKSASFADVAAIQERVTAVL